jgi:hypothetical protein
MQHISIYQVEGDPIEVRRAPTTADDARTSYSFQPSDLVAIDLIRYYDADINNEKMSSASSHRRRYDDDIPQDGPYLRLADGTGWLFAQKDNEILMTAVDVMTGLWEFYIDNFPEGQVLLQHPNDRAEFSICKNNRAVMYEPLQKIYCDARVKNAGVNFYRVQGSGGWVCSRRPDRRMLMDESRVKTGFFCYQAAVDASIRNIPHLGDETRTGRTVCVGEVAVANFIVESKHGPVLHLSDGSGWIYVFENNRQVMTPYPSKYGTWYVCVLNPPNGIPLCRHPIDDQLGSERQKTNSSDQNNEQNHWITISTELSDMRISVADKSVANKVSNMRYTTEYEPGTVLQCDVKITCNGVNFYRVKDTRGFVYDSKNGEKTLEIISRGLPPKQLQLSPEDCTNAWSTDFVRGAATSVQGMKELLHSKERQAITFKSEAGVRIHVYYTSRTVGVNVDDPVHGKMQMFCRDCSDYELGQILRDPPTNQQSRLSSRWSRRPTESDVLPTGNDDEDNYVEEEGFRNELLVVEREIKDMEEKRLDLLKRVKTYDDKRAAQALFTRKERIRRQEELDAAHKDLEVEVTRKVQLIAQRQDEERQREEEKVQRQECERKKKQDLVCNECYMSFSSAKDRDMHCRQAHGLVCEQCKRIFRSFHLLDLHCAKYGHY